MAAFGSLFSPVSRETAAMMSSCFRPTYVRTPPHQAIDAAIKGFHGNLGNHCKLVSATTKSKEELWVLFCVGVGDGPVIQDTLKVDDIVACKALIDGLAERG